KNRFRNRSGRFFFKVLQHLTVHLVLRNKKISKMETVSQVASGFSLEALKEPRGFIKVLEFYVGTGRKQQTSTPL
ncbi:hypothetical protein ElyMa_001965200, partial [Elysia marginata]